MQGEAPFLFSSFRRGEVGLALPMSWEHAGRPPRRPNPSPGLEIPGPTSQPVFKWLGNVGRGRTDQKGREDPNGEEGGSHGPGEGYHVDELVAELLQDDDDPGGGVVVLGRGPDEADGVQHLGNEGGQLWRDSRASQPTTPGGHPKAQGQALLRPTRLIPAMWPPPRTPRRKTSPCTVALSC